jgi:hypothetical protein
MKRKSKTDSPRLDFAQESWLCHHKRVWAEKLLKQADTAEAKAKHLRCRKDYAGAKRNFVRAAELFQDGALLMAEVETHLTRLRGRRGSVVCR